MRAYLVNNTCVQIPANSIIDTAQTYLNGTPTIAKCSASLTSWNLVQAMIMCPSLNLTMPTKSSTTYFVTANHFELDGYGCSLNQYITVKSTGITCQSCGSQCASCNMAPNSCTSCLYGLSLVNGTCTCGAGLAFDLPSLGCKPCPTDCLACSSPSTCT
jgi:hypothetical protein